MWTQKGVRSVYQDFITYKIEGMEKAVVESVTSRELEETLEHLGFDPEGVYWVLRENYTISAEDNHGYYNDPFHFYDDDLNDLILQEDTEYVITATGFYGSWKKMGDILQSILHTDMEEIIEKNGHVAIAIGPHTDAPMGLENYCEIILGTLVSNGMGRPLQTFRPIVSYDAYKLKEIETKHTGWGILDVLFQDSDSLPIKSAKKIIDGYLEAYIAKGQKISPKIKSPAIDGIPEGEITRDLMTGFVPYVRKGNYPQEHLLTREILEEIIRDHWECQLLLNTMPSRKYPPKPRFLMFINGVSRGVGFAEILWFEHP